MCYTISLFQCIICMSQCYRLQVNKLFMLKKKKGKSEMVLTPFQAYIIYLLTINAFRCLSGNFILQCHHYVHPLSGGVIGDRFKRIILRFPGKVKFTVISHRSKDLWSAESYSGIIEASSCQLSSNQEINVS